MLNNYHTMLFVLAKLGEVDVNTCVKAQDLYSLRLLAGFTTGALLMLTWLIKRKFTQLATILSKLISVLKSK